MDLRKLDHLVAVAEEGSFTRAATRLHLSQQALSSSIRSLEREVGVPLLERGASGVTPLPAGRSLIEDARVLHGVARSALRRARQVGRGETQVLRIGHTPAVTGEEISELAQAALTEQPGLRTEVSQRYPGDLTAGLVGGELDLGLCRGMRPERGLTRTTLTHHRLHIAVSAEHPLAGRAAVELSELDGETFTVWGEPGLSGYTELLLNLCREAGFEPRHTRSAIQGTSPVATVIGTGQVAFVTTPPGPAAHGRVRVLELHPVLRAPLHALWSPHTTNPARDTFIGGGH